MVIWILVIYFAQKLILKINKNMKIKSTLLNCGLALALTTGSVFAQEEPAQEEKQSVLEKYPWMQNLYFSGSLGSNLAVTDIKQYNTWPTYKFSSRTHRQLPILISTEIRLR